MAAKYPSLEDITLINASKLILRLSKRFTKSQMYERYIQAILLGFLEAHHPGKMLLEYNVGKHRIDYRKGGAHPSLVELVTIPKKHGKDYYPYRNVKELEKLCKFPFSKARKRILLIIDMFYKEPLGRDYLKDRYEKRWNRIVKESKMKVNGVRVLYVHPAMDYWFSLHPDGEQKRRMHAESR